MAEAMGLFPILIGKKNYKNLFPAPIFQRLILLFHSIGVYNKIRAQVRVYYNNYHLIYSEI